MSDWEDDYGADGVALLRPPSVQVKSWRPPSPQRAQTRDTDAPRAEMVLDGGQWSNWREPTSKFCDGETRRNNSYGRSRGGRGGGCFDGERSRSSPIIVNVDNSLVGRIIGEMQMSYVQFIIVTVVHVPDRCMTVFHPYDQVEAVRKSESWKRAVERQ